MSSRRCCSPRDGPHWEDFHLRELPGILADGYGGGPRRAIAGLSMGGLGAMDYAAQQPEMFRAAASFSGVLHPLGAPHYWLGLLSNYTDDPDAVWGDPQDDRDVWARHDPTALLPALAGTPLFVSAGDGRPGPLEHGRGTRDPTEAEVGGDPRGRSPRVVSGREVVRRDCALQRALVARSSTRPASFIFGGRHTCRCSKGQA